MDEDGERVAADAASGRHHEDLSGLVVRRAGGEISYATGGVAIPGAGAEFARGGSNIGNGQVSLASSVEDAIGVGANGRCRAFAVGRRGGAYLADLRIVQRDAEDPRLQCDCKRLADDRAGGTTVAIHHRSAL